MKKKILTIAILATVALSACTGTSNKDNAATTTTTETVGDDIVTMPYTDKDGENLEVVYNNTKGIALVTYKGETIEMEQQKTASGIWYINDKYEWRGKGNDIELIKDGEVVFMHEDVIVQSSLKDKDGQTLDMTFNTPPTRPKFI